MKKNQIKSLLTKLAKARVQVREANSKSDNESILLEYAVQEPIKKLKEVLDQVGMQPRQVAPRARTRDDVRVESIMTYQFNPNGRYSKEEVKKIWDDAKDAVEMRLLEAIENDEIKSASAKSYIKMLVKDPSTPGEFLYEVDSWIRRHHHKDFIKEDKQTREFEEAQKKKKEQEKKQQESFEDAREGKDLSSDDFWDKDAIEYLEETISEFADTKGTSSKTALLNLSKGEMVDLYGGVPAGFDQIFDRLYKSMFGKSAQTKEPRTLNYSDMFKSEIEKEKERRDRLKESDDSPVLDYKADPAAKRKKYDEEAHTLVYERDPEFPAKQLRFKSPELIPPKKKV